MYPSRLLRDSTGHAKHTNQVLASTMLMCLSSIHDTSLPSLTQDLLVQQKVVFIAPLSLCQMHTLDQGESCQVCGL